MAKRISSTEANNNLDTNPGSWWARDGVDTQADGTYAVQRLANDYFPPLNSRAWAGDFHLSADSSLFAIGSCFARGIETSLVAAGFNVPSYADEFDGFALSRPDVSARGFTNKYSTFAIENELRWALDPTSPFPENSLVDVSETITMDPHVNPTLLWIDRASTIERRATITEVYGRAANVDALVVTLGLVEAWYDTHADVWLNMTPRAEMFEMYPDRYVFEVTNFAANRAALERISELMSRHADPDCHIIVTVSPVPLMATFSLRDVVAANTYSKGVLRAAAEEWSMDHDNVHYFPSYEMVMNSDPAKAWAPDRRHVQGPMVGQIMRLFRQQFIQ